MFFRFFAGALACLPLLAAGASAAPAPAPRAAGCARFADRVEPAFWWVGFAEPRLQVLVHGRDVAGATPELAWPGVTLEGVTRVANPNYLFLNLRIAPDARPGRFRIGFRRDGRRVAACDYQLRARRPGSAQREGFGPRDAIYLLMPDRFANGDPANDRVPGYADRVDRGDGGARHGGDLAGILAHLDYVAGLGFTQLWSTPLLENAAASFSYHGYAMTDLYAVDPRYGTLDDYLRLGREARARGVGLIMDMVVNHVGIDHWWLRDPPTPDWINGGGRFSPTNHAHTARLDPHAVAADRQAYEDGWFVATMPDLNQRNALLATYLIQNAIWWIELADLSGIRMDTYSYPNAQFMAQWTARVMREYPRFNVVGEEWNSSPAIVSYWQAGKHNADGYVSSLPSLMDFPVQHALELALAGPAKPAGQDGLRRLYETLSEDFQYPDPTRLVVFVDNHDLDRAYAQVGRDLGRLQTALAFIATTRGTPQLFYGTEVLLANDRPGDDGDRRRDFPGGWAGDPVNAFTGRGLSDAQREVQAYVRALFNWRRRTPVLHGGALSHYVPRDGVYVYVRHDATARVLVALNRNAADVPLDFSRYPEFVRAGDTAREALTGAPIDLTRPLLLKGNAPTLIEIR